MARENIMQQSEISAQMIAVTDLMPGAIVIQGSQPMEIARIGNSKDHKHIIVMFADGSKQVYNFGQKVKAIIGHLQKGYDDEDEAGNLAEVKEKKSKKMTLSEFNTMVRGMVKEALVKELAEAKGKKKDPFSKLKNADNYRSHDAVGKRRAQEDDKKKSKKDMDAAKIKEGTDSLKATPGSVQDPKSFAGPGGKDPNRDPKNFRNVPAPQKTEDAGRRRRGETAKKATGKLRELGTPPPPVPARAMIQPPQKVGGPPAPGQPGKPPPVPNANKPQPVDINAVMAKRQSGQPLTPEEKRAYLDHVAGQNKTAQGQAQKQAAQSPVGQAMSAIEKNPSQFVK